LKLPRRAEVSSEREVIGMRLLPAADFDGSLDVAEPDL